MSNERYRTIHYTELPPSQPGSELHLEWETYRREVGRLLAEGHEGKHVLIKGTQILGLFDTHEDALAAGYQAYLRESFLVRHVQTRERLYFIGYNQLCRT
jgi:hypothetical protein